MCTIHPLDKMNTQYINLLVGPMSAQNTGHIIRRTTYTDGAEAPRVYKSVQKKKAELKHLTTNFKKNF